MSGQEEKGSANALPFFMGAFITAGAPDTRMVPFNPVGQVSRRIG